MDACDFVLFCTRFTIEQVKKFHIDRNDFHLSGLLCELAEQNNWVTFLFEAESQQFPSEQVLHIVEHYFTNVGLREHLSLAIRNSISLREARNHCSYEYLLVN